MADVEYTVLEALKDVEGIYEVVDARGVLQRSAALIITICGRTSDLPDVPLGHRDALNQLLGFLN
jgi:hypothetical protein